MFASQVPLQQQRSPHPDQDAKLEGNCFPYQYRHQGLVYSSPGWRAVAVIHTVIRVESSSRYQSQTSKPGACHRQQYQLIAHIKLRHGWSPSVIGCITSIDQVKSLPQFLCSVTLSKQLSCRCTPPKSLCSIEGDQLTRIRVHTNVIGTVATHSARDLWIWLWLVWHWCRRQPSQQACTAPRKSIDLAALNPFGIQPGDGHLILAADL